MKKITIYSIILFLFTFSSCVKETDITIETEPEVILQEGETRLLTGLVRDTSGVILPEASVKIILDDLELETVADENGAWSLTIPNSLTEGYIVANKVAYSKSIQRFYETENNQIEDIYLAEEPSNTELNLSFVLGNLKILKGRFIDQNSSPIPDVKLFLFSFLEGAEMESALSSFISTRMDGTFEIIYEDNGISSSTLYALFNGGCGENLSFAVHGQDLIEDLGDLVLSNESYSIFQTSLESDGSSCYDSVSVLAYNYGSQLGFLPFKWDQPLGDISLEYCPNDGGAFYIGVESADNTHFNGLFLSENDVEPSYIFDICTPNPEDFLELTINGNVEMYEANLSFIEPRTVVSQNEGAQLYFRVLNWATYTPLDADSPAYQIGELKSLFLEASTTQIEFSNLDADAPSFNYVNIVQDDDLFYAGIAQTKFTAPDGSITDITIRFRVAK